MPKNQTKASTPVPAQESRFPVSFDVRVYPVKDSKYTLANANVDINGVFAIRGVKVIRSEKGPFVAMPQYKDSRGDYNDICFPCTKVALASSSTMRCWMPMSSRSDSPSRPSRRTMLPLRNRPCNHPQHKTYNLEEIIT